MLETNESCKKFTAFRKDAGLKQIIGRNTIHDNKNLETLKIIINQESVSHAIQNVALPVNNLSQQKYSKVIKPTKLFKSSIKSTVKAVSLFTYSALKMTVGQRSLAVVTTFATTEKLRLEIKMIANTLV